MLMRQGHARIVFLTALLLASTGGLAKDKKEKRPKIKWKDVQVVETEPAGCEFIEKIDKDSNSFMVFTGKQFKEKALRGLKKKAGKLGANTVFITDKMIVSDVLNYEAKIFHCDPTAKTPEDKAESKGT